MHKNGQITQIKTQGIKNAAAIVFVLILSMLTGYILVFSSYKLLFPFLFAGVILVLYFKQFEILIVLIFVINHELFYLLPSGALGRDAFQDLLFVIILLLLGARYFLDKKARNYTKGHFGLFILFFLFLVFVGIFKSYYQGQPLIYGMKAAKGYYLILFYFVFMSKEINTQKLFRLIIIAGILLFILNNIKYAFFDSVGMFYIDESEISERANNLRFIVGDFFINFAPIITFGEYLRTRKKLYLLIFLYMVATVVIQGQTRAVIVGITVSILFMLYFSRCISFSKVACIIPLLIILSIWVIPMLEATFLGRLYEITKSEIKGNTGNVGIRVVGYKYYFSEIVKSPIIGKGIWNILQTKNNPEDMRYTRIYLADIGLTKLLFHFGIFGVVWLFMLLSKVYKISFQSLGRLKENVHYSLLGYFIFSIATMATLDCFVDRFTIIYLALVLALLSQTDYSTKDQQRG